MVILKKNKELIISSILLSWRKCRKVKHWDLGGKKQIRKSQGNIKIQWELPCEENFFTSEKEKHYF